MSSFEVRVEFKTLSIMWAKRWYLIFEVRLKNLNFLNAKWTKVYIKCRKYLNVLYNSVYGHRSPPPISPLQGVVVVVIPRIPLIWLITMSLIKLIRRSSMSPLSATLSSPLSPEETSSELSYIFYNQIKITKQG